MWRVNIMSKDSFNYLNMFFFYLNMFVLSGNSEYMITISNFKCFKFWFNVFRFNNFRKQLYLSFFRNSNKL